MHRDLERQNTVLFLRLRDTLGLGRILFQALVILRLTCLCLHDKIAPYLFLWLEDLCIGSFPHSLLKCTMHYWKPCGVRNSYAPHTSLKPRIDARKASNVCLLQKNFPECVEPQWWYMILELRIFNRIGMYRHMVIFQVWKPK